MRINGTLGLAAVCFSIGIAAPLAFASSHCDTLMAANGDHLHVGQENVNNNCSGGSHGASVIERFDVYGGADTVAGESDVDDIEGSSGRDILRGGAADDWVVGQGDEDSIYGGWGTDTLEGGSGAYSLGDQIFGEENYDYIYGGDGPDLLSGDAGDDTLEDQCCGWNDIYEKDTACGKGGADDINVADGNEEDKVYDPGNSDYVIRDYPGDLRTTLECPF